MLTSFSSLGLSFLFVIGVLLGPLHFVDSLTITSMLEGNKLRCNEEGQRVELPFLQSDPCITCMCINSEVDCFKNTCAESLHCYHYQSNSSTGCCRKCRACRVGDQTLTNGGSMQDSVDPCLSYHCNSGTLTQHRTQCYVPCNKPISLLGQCCPSCNACPRSHMADHQEVPGAHDDPCIRCHCFKGQMICTRRVCPVLPCSTDNQIHPNHACCPICRGNGDSNRLLSTTSDCVLEDKIYGHLEEFRPDPCTECQCENGTNKCWRESCPPLPCALNERIQEKNQCCAKCANGPRVRKEPHTECVHKSQRYKTGHRWKDGCHECTCREGHTLCHLLDCPHDFVCPSGHRKVRLNGECCDTCIRDDGKCLASHGLSQITTFDGLHYTWTGRCNYVLTRDCVTKQFSVHAIHKFHNQSIRTEPIYRGFSLLVKLGSTRIYLSTLGRVRVNRTLVELPYIHLAQFTIMQSGQMIKLRALMGMELLWKINQSVEIRVKSHFQDKTCGLCGNFNLNNKDEFRAKNSGQVTSLEMFANSFKIGQNVLCPRTKPVILRKMTAEGEQPCNITTAERICRWLQKRFPICRGSLRNELAFQQCREKMCSCGSNKQCQCTMLKHYITGCHSENEGDTKLNMFTCQAPKCPAGSEYKLCSVHCKKTCRKRGEVERCGRKQCRSGCECIGNRVWHGGQCIPEVMCPVH